MHDDPATTQPPRITDPDDAHIGRDLVDAGHPAALAVHRSPNAWVCPFLLSLDADRRPDAPVEVPDPVNRCAALHDPVPQSLRQQELVCLTSGHVNCPRYLRGSHAPTDPVEQVRGPQVVTPAIAGSVLILAIAFLLSLAFVVTKGGLTLTAAEGLPSPSGAVLAGADPTPPPPTTQPTETTAPSVTPAPTPTLTATPAATPGPTPIPTATPSPAATPTADPTAAPTETPGQGPAATPKAALPPGATASRMKLVTPCPDRAKCYIYRIRSGDNLYSIANYFGVSFDTVKAWNPWTNNGLRIGRELRIPPPTN